VEAANLLQLITSLLNLGVLGVAFYLFVGGRLHSSGELERMEQERDRTLRRVEQERDRAIADRRSAEAQRDVAMKIAQEQLMPLLSNFITTTSVLTPLLQELVRFREYPNRPESRER
jgi:hypothetical protein